jgi:hypothetical protein
VVDQLHERLAQVFGNLAVELRAQKSTAEILQSIVQAAAAKVPSGRAVAELDELTGRPR